MQGGNLEAKLSEDCSWARRGWGAVGWGQDVSEEGRMPWRVGKSQEFVFFVLGLGTENETKL